MHLLRFIPIKLTIVLIMGILVGHYLDLGIQLPIILTAISFCSLSYLFIKKTPRNSISFGLTALLATLCIGILSISLWKPKNQNNHYTHLNLDKSLTWKFKIREVLKSSTFSDRYIANALSTDEINTKGKILLSFTTDSTTKKLRVDDELLVFGKLSEISTPLNPHQFDYKNYLEGLGIYHQLRLYETNHFLDKNKSTTIYGIAASIRTQIIEKLKQADFDSERLGIIQALLLGQRNDISEATYNNYKNAGAVHILALSGLHIGILLLLLQFLLSPLERLAKGKTIKLVIIVILLWSFALLAGLSASIIRAVTMFSFVAYAIYLNRPSNTFNILALSMFFILLVINPMLLFQAGFQMSYAAVFSIVWLYPLLQKLWFPKNWIINKVWQLLSVSIAAQLGVLPISLFYFHQFPGLFFISNLLVVPFLGLILGMGILVIAIALCNSLPSFLANLYNSLIGLMNEVIAWVAQQEAFVFRNISFDIIQLVLSYFIIITFITVFTKATFKRVTVFLVGIIGFQIWLFFVSYSANQKEILLVAHQTKNSILIYQTGNSSTIIAKDLITTKRIITDYTIAERVKHIDYSKIKNSYMFKNATLLVVDSLGVYSNQNTDYLLLTQSPKINLERLIDSINPKQIIADGSNYHSYIDRWRKTCLKRKLPFHYTGEKGAYYFEGSD